MIKGQKSGARPDQRLLSTQQRTITHKRKHIFQATIPSDFCSNENYKRTIKIKININSEVKNGDVLCCATSGCNWNYTTTYNNMSFDAVSFDAVVVRFEL